MPIGSCSKSNLLTVFADNVTNDISAADMRLLINCVYDNFLDVQNVIDDLDTYNRKQALSANSGAVLNDKIENNIIEIVNIQANKANKSETYSRSDSDSRYYTQSFIDSNYYKTNESYNKTQIDQALQSVQLSLDAISARIDGIVQANNLIDPTNP